MKKILLLLIPIATLAFFFGHRQTPTKAAISNSFCTPPNTPNTDWTISAPCVLYEDYNGPANGNLTVASGTALTLHNGKHLVWYPGKSITIQTGASIIVNTGSEITQKKLCINAVAVPNATGGYTLGPGETVTVSTSPYLTMDQGYLTLTYKTVGGGVTIQRTLNADGVPNSQSYNFPNSSTYTTTTLSSISGNCTSGQTEKLVTLKNMDSTNTIIISQATVGLNAVCGLNSVSHTWSSYYGVARTANDPTNSTNTLYLGADQIAASSCPSDLGYIIRPGETVVLGTSTGGTRGDQYLTLDYKTYGGAVTIRRKFDNSNPSWYWQQDYNFPEANTLTSKTLGSGTGGCSLTTDGNVTLTNLDPRNSIEITLATAHQTACSPPLSASVSKSWTENYSYVDAVQIADRNLISMSGSPTGPGFLAASYRYLLNLGMAVNSINSGAKIVQAAANNVQVVGDNFFVCGPNSDSTCPTSGFSNYGNFYISGNIGIGTTAPAAKLESAATTEQLRLAYTAGSVYSSQTVDSSGNLTIDNTGTKTAIADDLQVTGNDILDSGATSRITLGATTTLTNTTTTLSGTTTVTASSLATLTTAASLAMSSTTTLTLGSNAIINGGSAANDDLTLQGTSNATKTSSYVIIQPTSGNVGIGTTAPGGKLDVSGGYLNVINAEANAGTMRLGAINGMPGIYSNVASKPLSIRSDTGLRFSGTADDMSATADMVIDTSGQVGIGTTAPAATLDIQGTETGTSGSTSNVVSNTTRTATLTADSTLLGINSTTLSRMTENGFNAYNYSGNFTAYTDGTQTFSWLRGINATAYSNSTSATNQDSIGGAVLSGYLNSSGTITNVFGSYNQGYNTSTGTVTQAIGTYGLGFTNNSGSVTTAYGTYGIAFTSNGPVTTAIGTQGTVYSSGGNIGTARGLASRIYRSSGTGTLTTGEGVYTSCEDFVTCYGVFIQTGDPQVTNEWGLYEAGAADNYLQGNLGIGTTAPTQKIELASGGNIQLNSGNIQDYGDITIKADADNNGTNVIKFLNGAGGEIMRLQEAGKVGIGNTNPSYALDVTGQVRISNFTGTGGVPAYENAGILGVQSSDQRLKENIKTQENALDKVMKLRGVNFNFKNDPEKRMALGFIAQEVQPIVPEAVFSYKNNDGQTFYGVYYAELTSLLTNAIKDQQKEIDALKQQVNELQKEIEAIKNKL